MNFLFGKLKSVSPPPVPAPPPTPVPSGQDATGDLAMEDALRQSSFRKTILAGDLEPSPKKKLTLG
jgi:hypothetical protein